MSTYSGIFLSKLLLAKIFNRNKKILFYEINNDI